MIDRMAARLRSSFLIWIVPAGIFQGGSGRKRFPLLAVLYVIALLEVWMGGFSWSLMMHLFYPEYAAENVTKAPPVETLREMVKMSHAVTMVFLAIFEILLLIFLLARLRRVYVNPDSLGRTLSVSEEERRRSLFTGGIVCYMLLAFFPLFGMLLAQVLTLPFFALGLAVCAAVFTVGFRIAFQESRS